MQNQKHHTINTVKQMHTLERAGFDKQQIEALIEVIGQQVHAAVSSAMVNLATKDDLKNFVTKDDLKNFATKDDLERFVTKDDFHKTINRILMWVPAVMFGTIIATAATVTLLIKFLA